MERNANQLTIANCKDYLESMAFTNVKFLEEKEGKLYFKAVNEDSDSIMNKEIVTIEFEKMDSDIETVLVSVKLGKKWHVFDKLYNDCY